MKTPPRHLFTHSGGRSGMALIITLLLLSLMTIIAIAFLGTMTWQMSASRRNYENERARALTRLGLNCAVAQLRLAIGNWDDPFNNFTNAAPTYYWSISPGVLTRWSYSQAAPLTNYPLFSIDPNGSSAVVNLNAQAGDGTYPILGNTRSLSVYWVNVLKNPANTTASSLNPIIGRYAFWVDDENAKINLNTADGTLKYTTNSLGLGTPSEVDLRVLQQGGANLSAAMASNIVYVARTTGYNSPHEILRASSATSDLYSTNLFSLTTWSRSPELNLFGEPKISLAPAVYAPQAVGNPVPGYLRTNGITGQSLTEIYPAPNQLPGFISKGPLGTQPGVGTRWRPLMLSQEWGYFNGDSYGAQAFQGNREGYAISTLSLYLSGTNSVYKPITWPVFPFPSMPLSSTSSTTSSGTSGFLGKYSLRQLDSLVVQAVDVAGKSTLPELPSEGSTQLNSNGTTFTVPDDYFGFLSHQLVPGAGRTAKVNEILMQATVAGPNGTIGSIGYTPPTVMMSVFVEFYLPAGFGGVDLFNINSQMPSAVVENNDAYELGGGPNNYNGNLNVYDLPNPNGNSSIPTPLYSTNYAFIGRSSAQPYGGTQPLGYWGDTLLQNNAGIDMMGNAPGPSTNYLDPDQIRAAAYHPWATNAAGQYLGTGPVATQTYPMLRMGYLSASAAFNGTAVTPWLPGQYRVINNNAASTAYKMSPSASTVTFWGGVSVTGYTRSPAGDPDPTPFDAGTRGAFPLANSGNTNVGWSDYYAAGAGGERLTYLAWTNSIVATRMGNQAQTGYNLTETVRDRITNDLIPVGFPSMTVPSSAASATYGWYHAEVADPLVNKFPGDWQTNFGAGNSPPNTMGGAGSGLPTVSANHGGSGGYAAYYNGQNAASTTSGYKDPDSFWMPPLDPKIPRSARFPNVGYFNYLRTGIIPDDETGALNTQHGTPFRCLNFNALNNTDAPQTGPITSYRTASYYYPDWAFLDLVTVPSTLLPYNGPYGYYNSSGVWTAGALYAGNPTNMYNYGTWGGSTPGRINPNGSVLYTTNVNTPVPGLVRTLPMQALLHNIAINQSIATGTSAATATTNAPTFTGGTIVDDAGLSQAIASYIGTYGPLREPAEICNIPAMATNFPSDGTHYNPTRNDLVRQIVGNLTTQSNVFSIWVEGESIAKSKSNNNPANQGIYEAGDQITGTARYHFVVERYLDLGVDGGVGNATSTGADGVAGSYDDISDTTNNPSNPRYFYRVIYAEEIRN